MGRGCCPDFAAANKWTRRAALEAGWLGALSLGSSALIANKSHASTSGGAAPPSFGKAKRCLLIFMWGGPSQLDTWDMKPDAPAEIRGEFKPIATSVPGTFISEHFPRLAQQAHRYAIIRSLTHEDRAHLSSAHHILTGVHAPKRFSDDDSPSPIDTPHLGSVIARMNPGTGVPSFVMMPWIVSHPAAPGGRAPGQHAGWLGRRYDPLLVGDPSQPNFTVPGCQLPADVSGERLASRRELLSELDHGNLPVSDWSIFSQQAVELILSPKAQKAFALDQEPSSVRDAYGRHTHGQSLLLARRLLEAGVPLVTVNWHDDGTNFWDTHHQNFKKLKEVLMPQGDSGLSSLLDDLDARGLLDETLVVWVGEFGRKPQISREVAGREHWARCYSAVVAGGGIAGGTVYGTSDRIASYPLEKPVSPSDLVATIYHALGINSETTLYDRQQVPKHIVQGRVIEPLFS